jgi:UDP-glucose 6-dehydrogenase
MNLSVIGTGYVGLVTGACIAEMGNIVTCVDTDGARIGALRAGKVHFHEPGLEELLSANSREGRLRFTGSHAEALAVALIERLLEAGVRVRAYDPVAMVNAPAYLSGGVAAGGKLEMVEHQYDAIAGADALALATE